MSSDRLTLDAAGNRTRAASTEHLSPDPSACSLSYEYDARYRRLLSAGFTSYLYDKEGPE